MNSRFRLSPRLVDASRQISRIAWVLFLLCLPVTSFRFFPSQLGGATLVRPLAVYPLLVLLVVCTLPRLCQRPLEKPLLALAAYGLVALGSVWLASLQSIETAQGVSVGARMLRALVTLALGGAVYATALSWPENPEDLKFSLHWLYAGLAIALFWGSIQAVFNVLRYTPAFFKALNKVQLLFSIRVLIPHRVSGFAYEPNWFADQIGLLLFPWLFAAVLRDKTIFPWRKGRLTIEWLLLLWGAVILIFTFSRTGLINLAVVTFVSVLFFTRSARQPKAGAGLPRAARWFRRVRGRFGVAALAVLVLAGVFILVGTQNKYFSRLWNFWSLGTRDQSYLDYIAVGGRLVYWQAALSMFETQPLLGVGLGNYAFYFEENLPERSYQSLPEVMRIITHSKGGDRLITPKSLYARLLAETGLLGTAAFLAFIIASLGCAVYLWLAPDPEQRYWGLAGILGLFVLLVTAYSSDSFSIPDMWVFLGLIAAAARIYAPASQDQSGLASGQTG